MTTTEPNVSALDEVLWKAKNVLHNADTDVRERFKSRQSDVIICTPMKCGTAWLQQICHQIRSGGDESYDDIDLEVEWLFEASCVTHLRYRGSSGMSTVQSTKSMKTYPMSW